MRARFPKLRPIYCLLLATGFGAAGLVEGWLIINLFLPLVAAKPGIIYYPAEDRIFVDNMYQMLECDAEHRLTDRIPLDPPFAFKRIAPDMLFICDKPGQEQK